MDDDQHYAEASEHGSFGKLILRLTVAILLLFHGVPKLLNPQSVEGIKGKLVEFDLPAELYYGVYAGEIVAPILLIIGLFCRFGGLLIAINMVFAVVLMHLPELLQFKEYGGYALELQMFFLFSGVAVLALGSGRVALRPD